jgi:hypothetical protein
MDRLCRIGIRHLNRPMNLERRSWVLGEGRMHIQKEAVAPPWCTAAPRNSGATVEMVGRKIGVHDQFNFGSPLGVPSGGWRFACP